MTTKTIHQITTSRSALADDELEVQAAGGGASARVAALTLAALVTAAHINSALGYTAANAATLSALSASISAVGLSGAYADLTGKPSLATVATSGAYADLSGKPTLGTVAALASDTDGTLAANSDVRVATQKALKTYVDNAVTGLLDFKGSTDASGNPNYPAALKGDSYFVSVAGKVGGASGKSVEIGDLYVASADNAGGTEASVGTSWFVMEHNLVGAVISGGALGTPSSGNLANCTSLPVSTGISGFGTGVAAFLATPSSANLAAALTDKTGAGLNVFQTSPTLVTPALGVATATSINKVALTAPATGSTLTIADGVTLTVSANATISGTPPSLGANAFTAAQSITQTINATSADGLLLTNTTAAAAGAQQWSPRLHFTGQGWKTNATAASQAVDWIAEVQPVQGAASPIGSLVFSSQVNGGGYTAMFKLNSGPNFGQALFVDGNSGAAAAIGFINDPNTGFSRVTTGAIAISSVAVPVVMFGGGGVGTRFHGTFGLGFSADVANSANDAIWTRGAAATIQQGDVNAASPVNQTYRAQGSRSGTDTNVAGANLTLQSGPGTGNSTGSSLIFQTPLAVASGSGAQTMTTVLQLSQGARIGFYGTTPAVQATGYGTPTNAANQGSFDATTITLPNLAAHVARLSLDLKATGLIAA